MFCVGLCCLVDTLANYLQIARNTPECATARSKGQHTEEN